MAPRQSLPCSQKFGAPLYAGAFLTDELLVLGGGGGKKSSGIPNRCGRLQRAAPELTASPCRLLVARWAAGVLEPEPVFTLSTTAPPERCVSPPPSAVQH